MIILYTLIRTNHIDEPRRVIRTPQIAIFRSNEVATIQNVEPESDIVILEAMVQYRNNNNEVSQTFNGIHELRTGSCHFNVYGDMSSLLVRFHIDNKHLSSHFFLTKTIRIIYLTYLIHYQSIMNINHEILYFLS